MMINDKSSRIHSNSTSAIFQKRKIESGSEKGNDRLIESTLHVIIRRFTIKDQNLGWWNYVILPAGYDPNQNQIPNKQAYNELITPTLYEYQE